MYELAKELFPICRSITGNGVRETLNILKREVPELELKSVPSGQKAFDWVVPDEWNIKEAYIEDERGNRLVDFKTNNLHVVGYSTPVDKWIDQEELKQILHYDKDDPEAIPYVTSYYNRSYGFCVSKNQYDQISEGLYHIHIDSSLNPLGELNYAELIIPGSSKAEVFFSTYICHPSMANNEVSGPCVVTEIAKYLVGLENRKFTYRIVFLPETIGAIVYLSKHLPEMKKNIVAGFNVTCVGDDRTYSYVESRNGNTLTDRILQNVLKYHYPEYKKYSFLDRGSDERQYCAPGVDLPVCTVCRSKFEEYPEYHTSKDNLSIISEKGLRGTFDMLKKCINLLEYNERYKVTMLCEPQLGKRGLYPNISQRNSHSNDLKIMKNFIAYSDGENDLIDISEKIGEEVTRLVPIIELLMEREVIAF